MNNFTFHAPTEFVFGKDVENKTGVLCQKYGATKVLIVYGGGSVVRSGLLQRVKQVLDDARIPFAELGGIQPNPTDPKVYEGIEICRRESVDMLLAVGGGSVIDTAKAIAAGVPYAGDFWDFFVGKAVVKEALKVGVVLTIPAAGSEGSGNSVITKLDGLQKLSLRTPDALRPVFAIMNPELTYTLPPYQTACGVVDMMAHIMERYFSNTTGVEITDRLCEGALKAIIEVAHNGICGVGREEDWASHFMEHEISAVYNVTHGAGLAVVFPAWLTFMAEHHPGKVGQFAERVWNITPAGTPRETTLEGIASLKNFFASIGMPTSFAQLGIEHPDIDLLVEKLHHNKGELVGAYYKLSRDDSRRIYEIACR